MPAIAAIRGINWPVELIEYIMPTLFQTSVVSIATIDHEMTISLHDSVIVCQIAESFSAVFSIFRAL